VAREIVYIVQGYIAGKGNRLAADRPIPCKTAEAARRTAERCALRLIKCQRILSICAKFERVSETDQAVLHATNAIKIRFNSTGILNSLRDRYPKLPERPSHTGGASDAACGARPHSGRDGWSHADTNRQDRCSNVIESSTRSLANGAASRIGDRDECPILATLASAL
jgi:hypothetical protein